MNITPITDQTLLFLTSIILATTIIAILAFAFILYYSIKHKEQNVVKNFKASRVWQYICLSICAMIFFLLVLRGYVSTGVIAGFLGTAIGFAFGTKGKQTGKTDSDPTDSPDRENS